MKHQLYMILTLQILYFHTCLADSTERNRTDNNISQDLEVDRRIFGGNTVWSRLQYPFVARLFIKFRSGVDDYCTGVVLTDKIILTVAHCLSRPGGERAERVWATLQGGGTYIFNSKEIIVNQIYDKVYGADFAVLRKDFKYTFMTGYGVPPSLPPNRMPGDEPIQYASQPAVIVGFGRTSISDFNRFPRLQVARVNLMATTDTTCQNVYPEIINSMFVGERMLCTFNNVAGLCAGDWGSPLLVGNTIVGLAMFRSGGCTNQNNKPSAFNDLQFAASWLRTSFNIY